MSQFEIHTEIDLHDIQGNIIKAYGKHGLPWSRYLFYQVTEEAGGRQFIAQLLKDQGITSSAPWTKHGNQQQNTIKPEIVTNLAFTFSGLKHLGVPQKTLSSFPDEYVMGMRARTAILGDNGPSDPEHWDPIWHPTEHEAQPVHLMVSIAARTQTLLNRRTDEIEALAATSHLHLLTGHRDEHTDDARYQEGRIKDGKEHFGFEDGISDPYIKESGEHPDYVAGGGKRTRAPNPRAKDAWEPIETGELILGHVDEADEYPQAPIPNDFSRNGTYLVYRKLHQNVGSWNNYVETKGAEYGDPELFVAKLLGRWPNGAPIEQFPTKTAADKIIAEKNQANSARWNQNLPDDERDAAKKKYFEIKTRLNAFDYNTDLDGARCPVGAHIRRANPRGALEFGNTGAFNQASALTDRRRIARRGVTYGKVKDPTGDGGNHGILFISMGASISRQFEFVQQQWLNYGNDFKLSNDRDPIVGNHPHPDGGNTTIEGDPATNKPPYFCTGIPRFVETRGGDYFFVPSLTALDLIARAQVDPT